MPRRARPGRWVRAAILSASLAAAAATAALLFRQGGKAGGGSPSADADVVKLGYFHGGRSNMIYRTHLFGFFEKEGVKVELHTKILREPGLVKVPSDHQEMRRRVKRSKRLFGKMSGIEIVDKMKKGVLAGGVVGEASFVYCVHRGDPITAVAMLGHDVKGLPGKAIMLRNGLVIRSPEDFRGKTLASRRAGPGDAIFLREFLKDIGMLGDPTIRIIDQMDEDRYRRNLATGKIDGGLSHLKTAQRLVRRRAGYVYRRMDWMNPEISHALLVFRKDFLEGRPEAARKIVTAYMRRIRFEKDLPEERINRSWDKGLMMEGTFRGMSIPRYDYPPLVRMDLLEEMQALLLEYGKIKEKRDLSPHVDNGMLEDVHRTLEGREP